MSLFKNIEQFFSDEEKKIASHIEGAIENLHRRVMELEAKLASFGHSVAAVPGEVKNTVVAEAKSAVATVDGVEDKVEAKVDNTVESTVAKADSVAASVKTDAQAIENKVG